MKLKVNCSLLLLSDAQGEFFYYLLLMTGGW